MNVKDQEAYVLITKITKQSLLSLTGIFGIEPDFVPDKTNHSIKRSRGPNKNSNFKVTIKSKSLKVLKIEIDFWRHVIYIDLIKSNKGYTGISLPIIREIVSAARMSGLLYIRLWAYGHYKIHKKWTGYFVWGKYGFLMEPSYKEKFLNLMIDKSRDEQTLFELVKSDEGLNFWIQNGEDWWGRFFLHHNSTSRNHLAYALQKKRIKN